MIKGRYGMDKEVINRLTAEAIRRCKQRIADAAMGKKVVVEQPGIMMSIKRKYL